MDFAAGGLGLGCAVRDENLAEQWLPTAHPQLSGQIFDDKLREAT
jgi:hypothetical protein